MKKLICGVLLSSIATLAAAQWRVEREVDAMTDKVRNVAAATTKAGERVEVWRAADGRVWLTLELRPPSMDTPINDPGPMIRIDKNDAITYDKEPHIVAGPMMVQEGRWLSFIIWHGLDEEGRSAAVQQLMTGTRLVVRYSVFPAGYREAVYSLANAGPSIAKALAIPLKRKG